MIDEVLLTDKEIAHVCRVACHKNPHWQLDAWGLYDLVAKAAQLKLLEWLRGRCIEHPVRRGSEISCRRRWECPYCDAELESKLKEG